MLSDTWYLFHKYTIIALRMPLWSLFGLIQPLIWLFIFGSLFKNFASMPGFPGGSYIDYFVPGVLIMTVLFGSSWSGVSLLREISSGTVDKMLVSPASRSAIVLSRVLHSAVQVVLQSLVVLLAAVAMGADIHWNPIYLVAAMLVILCLGIAFASLSNGLAIVLQREEPLVVMGNIMTLPLMFFSTAMVPQAFMPDWIVTVSVINPVQYSVEAVRAVVVGNVDWSVFMKGFSVTFIFMVVVTYWAIDAFTSSRD